MSTEEQVNNSEQLNNGVPEAGSNGTSDAVNVTVGSQAEMSGETAGDAAESKDAAALPAELREMKERWLRAAADFENYKKRARKEQQDASIRSEDKVVCDFLPVMDNLQRALEHAEKTATESGGLIDGVKMVQKQFMGLLERYGITPVETIGKAFDPEQHEAIQQVDSDQPRNVIVMELQKGYRRQDRLVRPALVGVSAGPKNETSASQNNSDEQVT